MNEDTFIVPLVEDLQLLIKQSGELFSEMVQYDTGFLDLVRNLHTNHPYEFPSKKHLLSFYAILIYLASESSFSGWWNSL